jgi:hypothetical protein
MVRPTSLKPFFPYLIMCLDVRKVKEKVMFFFLINEELSFEHGKGKQGNKRECVIW